MVLPPPERSRGLSVACVEQFPGVVVAVLLCPECSPFAVVREQLRGFRAEDAVDADVTVGDMDTCDFLVVVVLEAGCSNEAGVDCCRTSVRPSAMNLTGWFAGLEVASDGRHEVFAASEDDAGDEETPVGGVGEATEASADGDLLGIAAGTRGVGASITPITAGGSRTGSAAGSRLRSRGAPPLPSRRPQRMLEIEAGAAARATTPFSAARSAGRPQYWGD